MFGRRVRLFGSCPVPAGWSCLRRPYLFPCAGKDRGEKGARVRLVHTTGAVSVSTDFFVAANTHTYLTGALVRAACYGTPDLRAAAFEYLR